MNELAGIRSVGTRATNAENFAEILRGNLGRFVADFGRDFRRARREKMLRREARGPSVGPPESVRMVQIEGRLAQRLEHPAYTGKVRGSNP